MKLTLLATAALLIVAGCASDPASTKERRDAMIQQAFPNPQDQAGLDGFFPLESGGVYKSILVSYFPQEVSKSEISRRVASFCAGQNSAQLSGKVGIKKDMGNGVRETASGQKKPVHTLMYRCL